MCREGVQLFLREGVPHHSLHQTSESLSLSVSCEWRVGLLRVGPKHQPPERPEGASCQLPKFFVGHVQYIQYLTALLCPLEDCEGGRGLVLRYFMVSFKAQNSTRLRKIVGLGHFLNSRSSGRKPKMGDVFVSVWMASPYPRNKGG